MDVMEDKVMWVYVGSVVVAVILIIIAIAIRKRQYLGSEMARGLAAQGGILGFLLFLLVIGFMTYGTYRIDKMLNTTNEKTIFRVFWAAQLIFLVLAAFAYRAPKIGAACMAASLFINIGLFVFFTVITQQNMVPSWCYFPYIVMIFLFMAGSAATTTPIGEKMIQYV